MSNIYIYIYIYIYITAELQQTKKIPITQFENSHQLKHSLGNYWKDNLDTAHHTILYMMGVIFQYLHRSLQKIYIYIYINYIWLYSYLYYYNI